MKATYVVAAVNRTNDPKRVAVMLAPQPQDEVKENPDQPGLIYLLPGTFTMLWDIAEQPPVGSTVDLTAKVKPAQAAEGA